MDVLSLDQLRASRGRRTRTVDLSAFGQPGAVIIGKMSIVGRDEFARTSQDKDDRIKGLATLLAVGLLEPKLSYEEARQLCECDADLVDEMAKAILEFNGMTKEAADELKKDFPAQSGPEVPVPAGTQTP